MPTYSYRCASCGHEFDKVQRITEDPERVCPNCGAEAASRVINSANFILKGSGWYSDLYSGGSNKKTAAAAEAGKSEGKTESKPASCDGSGTCGAGACATSTASTTSTSSTPAAPPAGTKPTAAA